MLETLEELPPETEFDPVMEPLVSTQVSTWDSLLADTHFILTTPGMPSDLTTAEVGSAIQAEQNRTVILAKGWPAPSSAAVAMGSLLAWQIAIAADHQNYLAQVEAVRAAYPEADIHTFDLAGTLADLLTTSALTMFSAETLFNADAPAGTETLTALAGLVVQMASAPFPMGPGEDLSVKILENYETISATIWEMVGGTLVETSSFTPTEPNDGEEIQKTEAIGAMSFVGTDEDDIIQFQDSYQKVSGGAGLDTLVMDVNVSQFIVSTNEDGSLNFTLPEAKTSLLMQDVERISFTNGNLAFDEGGIAGKAYRLYQACFDRQPDAEGLGFWIKQMDAGLSLQETAGYFLTSEEFATVYGKPSELADINYLALLYANVLDRAPDLEGFEFWREQQEKGVTRIDMLVAFSESEENVNRVAPAIDDGIWYL